MTGPREASPLSLSPLDREIARLADDARTPDVTVVVCTRARRFLLQRCLASLRELDDTNHEILVVENDVVPIAPGVAGGNVRWTHEPRPGLAFARNRGICEARGQIVAFVDDDCEVHPSWLAELRKQFEDPNVTCVTGRVIAAETIRPSQRFFERFASFDRGPESTRFHVQNGEPVLPDKASQLGTGCNMAFRRDMFSRVGPFDEALDTPLVIRGGGDLDIFARILEAQELVAYAPRAVVRHHHRETLPALAKQLFGYGAGLGALSVKYVMERRASVLTVVMFQAKMMWWIVRGAITRDDSVLVGLSLAGLEMIGDVVGPAAYTFVRARNRRRARS